MTSSNPPSVKLDGTVPSTNYYIENAVDQVDVHLQGQYFTSKTNEGLVSGVVSNVMFTIDRPANEVWPYLKDFNLWQKGHYYSGIIGDLEGKSFYLTASPSVIGEKDSDNKASLRADYEVPKVVPGYLIVISAPIPKGLIPGFPGLGRVSPGYHVFMLNEHGGKTVVTILMQHASLMELASGSKGMTDEEAIDPWRPMLKEGLRKWRDDFIPSLKRLVSEAKQK